jgi:MYXO-CTERM domain-containing protein
VCTPRLDQNATFRVNFDDVPESSTTDTVESETVSWEEVDGEGVEELWAREASSSTNHLFHGVDPTSTADGSLESPPLKVASSGKFTLAFTHRFQFETAQIVEGGALLYPDGAVIEITEDDGAKWTDISKYANPKYNGTIGGLLQGTNPLQDRQGYVGQNAAWPATETVTLDLGTAMAGKTVRIRFRIGADASVGASGWEIDDVVVTGITNKPFASIVADVNESEAYYADADGDGEGGGSPIFSCQLLPGYVTTGLDCDDSDSATYPGALEVCDEADNDCDGEADEEAVDGTFFYADGDGDGFGAANDSVVACSAPDGYVDNGDDCNDANADIYPGAAEPDDGIDHNCDGVISADTPHPGDDDTTQGDDDATQGGDDDATQGDDDATQSGDDDATQSGDDDATQSGDDDASQGDDDASQDGDDDASSGSDGGSDSTGCTCTQTGPVAPAPGALPLLGLAAGFALIRRRRG